MELFLITIAYLIGILIGLYFKKSIAFFVVLWGILFFYKKKNRYLKLYCKNMYMFIFIISFLLAFLRINLLEHEYSEKIDRINVETTNEKIEIIGTITSELKEEEYRTICDLNIERIGENTFYKNAKVKLYLKGKNIEGVYKYGDKISLLGNFELGEMSRNPGNFDYREYLKTKGIIRYCKNRF